MSELKWVWASEHAQERAIERWGIEPTREEWRELAMMILDTIAGTARALMIRRDLANGREHWLIALRGQRHRVLWEPKTASIVTVFA
jgi:hypothetical protein